MTTFWTFDGNGKMVQVKNPTYQEPESFQTNHYHYLQELTKGQGEFFADDVKSRPAVQGRKNQGFIQNALILVIFWACLLVGVMYGIDTVYENQPTLQSAQVMYLEDADHD
jgi:hypothetical protein